MNFISFNSCGGEMVWRLKPQRLRHRQGAVDRPSPRFPSAIGIMLALTLVYAALVCCCHAHTAAADASAINANLASLQLPDKCNTSSDGVVVSSCTNRSGQAVATAVVGVGVWGGSSSIDISYRHVGPEGVPALLDYLSQQDGKSTARHPSSSTTTTTTTLTATEGERSLGSTIETTTVREDSTTESNLDEPSALIALGLRECSLGDEGVEAISQSAWVSGRKSAKVLSLRHNQVTAAGIRHLLASLRSAPEDRLMWLELDFNPLSDGGVQPVVGYLKQRAARGGGGLEELSLRFCGVGPAGCRYLSSSLVKSAASASAYEAAVLAGPATSDGGAGVAHKTPSSVEAREKTGEEVESAKPPASGIRRLLLTGNHLGEQGARALASAVRKDRSLEVLDLTRCHIGDDGARCLADALRTNTCLRELRLGYNEISADGASALASLLHAGPGTLENLELGGNHIGDKGAIALAQGLAGNGVGTPGRAEGRYEEHRQTRAERQGPGLLRLGVSGNGIGCVGACALAKSLAGSGVALEELELAGNALTLRAVQASQVEKTSKSLYKSAGGALSSLLNQFVDESYYRADASSSSPTIRCGGAAKKGIPLRCGVAALATSLCRGDGDRLPSLRVLGLARTGITERDAARLAATLGRRRLGGPLEEVEVSMNGLGSAAVEAIQAAIAQPQGPPRPKRILPPNTNNDDKNEDVSKRARANEKQQISTVKVGGTGDVPSKNRDAGRGRGRWAEGIGGAGGVRERRSGGRGRASGRERQVGAYKPAAGKVELEVFGRQVASFGQTIGSGTDEGLDVQVFGKRVRFNLPSARPPDVSGDGSDASSDGEWGGGGGSVGYSDDSEEDETHVNSFASSGSEYVNSDDDLGSGSSDDSEPGDSGIFGAVEHGFFSDGEEEEEYDSSDSGSDDAGDGDGGEKRFREAEQRKTLEGDSGDDDVGRVGCQARQDNDDDDDGGERGQADRAEESKDRTPEEKISADRGSALALGSGGRAGERREADKTPTVPPSSKAPACTTAVATVLASSIAPPKGKVENLNSIHHEDQSKSSYAEWSDGFESDDGMPGDTSTTPPPLLALSVDNTDEREWHVGLDDHGTPDKDDAWPIEGEDSQCSGGMGDGDPWGGTG